MSTDATLVKWLKKNGEIDRCKMFATGAAVEASRDQPRGQPMIPFVDRHAAAWGPGECNHGGKFLADSSTAISLSLDRAGIVGGEPS